MPVTCAVLGAPAAFSTDEVISGYQCELQALLPDAIFSLHVFSISEICMSAYVKSSLSETWSNDYSCVKDLIHIGLPRERRESTNSCILED